MVSINQLDQKNADTPDTHGDIEIHTPIDIEAFKSGENPRPWLILKSRRPLDRRSALNARITTPIYRRARSKRMRRAQWVLLAGMVAVSVSLRPAIASVSPVLEAIRSDLTLSYAAVSLLTTVPTVCMGAFALAIPAITDRIGREAGVFWGIILITVATAGRVWSQNLPILVASTVLVGVGIAVTQALLPPLVTQYFGDRESFATGLYTASLTVGAAVAAGVTAPIDDAVGSWPVALAVWAVPAAIAVPIWYLSWRTGSRRRSESVNSPGRARFPWRNRWAVVLTLFFGGTATVFFFIVTWLAPRYVGLGWTSSRAGVLLSGFLFTQLAGNLVVTAVGDRLRDSRPLFAVMLGLVCTGACGVALAPESLPWLWVVALGIGTGGVFTLGLTLPITYTASPTATDGLSSMMLGGGYLIGSLGPFVAGVVRDATGSYAAVFGSLAVLALILLVVSSAFRPNRAPVTAQRHTQSADESTR
jgi:CP family cyanate transporter-like MFS transporter